MKKMVFLLFALFTGMGLTSQVVSGTWLGELKVGPQKLRLVFNVENTDDGYKATMDSPDQGAKGIPVTSVKVNHDTLSLELTALKISYQGVITGDVMTGTFSQSGMRFPMEMKRQEQAFTMTRPQNPQPPFPYKSEDLTFRNEKDGIELAGTLTLPERPTPVPAVILISGSGPQNRDEELMGHKPFLVLADYLTRNGIAVLRFDDRGVAASQGDFKTATTADFVKDVESAVTYLKGRSEINPAQIGLVGHSEGGIIAPIVAANRKDVAYIVLMAGTSIPGSEILDLQSDLIMKASGVPQTMITKSQEESRKMIQAALRSKGDVAEAKKAVRKAAEESVATLPESERAEAYKMIDAKVAQLTSPWMLYFLAYDPAPVLERVKCPVLALNGDKDLQVPSKINLEGIKTGLAKGNNKKVTIVELPGLNHLFQECTTGLPQEYAGIEQTISPTALKEIADWIDAQVR